MKTYQITLARSETRVVIVEIEAENEDAAEDIARDMLDDTDFDEGRAVHSDEWIQDTECMSEEVEEES
jgi:hypothetical protein